jgi:hypothetical protein
MSGEKAGFRHPMVGEPLARAKEAILALKGGLQGALRPALYICQIQRGSQAMSEFRDIVIGPKMHEE